MVALQHDPGLPIFDARPQIVHHALAVGATVNQIAEMDDGCIRIAGQAAVAGDAVMCIGQKPDLAVDIANGIGPHDLSGLNGRTLAGCLGRQQGGGVSLAALMSA